MGMRVDERPCSGAVCRRHNCPCVVRMLGRTALLTHAACPMTCPQKVQGGKRTRRKEESYRRCVRARRC